MERQVYFKVDGEWFTKHVRELYYQENYSYEDCKEWLVKSLRLNALPDVEKDELSKAIIYGKKKFIGINDFELVDDVEFDIYREYGISKPKYMRKGTGLTGILTVDGVFIECEYGGHDRALSRLPEGKSNGAMVFSTGSPLDERKISYIAKDKENMPIGEQQMEWINKNVEYLDDSQRNYMEIILKNELNTI